MKGFSDWANKNPKQAGGVAAGAFILAFFLIWFFNFRGNSSDSAAGTPGAGNATTGTTPPSPGGGYPTSGGAAGGYPGGSTGGAMASAGGASDSDELTKGKVPLGRINPMAPYWLVSLPQPPHVIHHTVTTTTTTGGTDGPSVFTPPTPEVSDLSTFWRFYRDTGVHLPVHVAPVIVHPQSEIGNAGGPPQRMAGIVYGADRVAAVIERGSTDATQPAISYVVQPGDQVGDETVISITPDSAILRKADGTLETVTLKAGSLKGLAPANEMNGFGSGMPGYPGMGYPGGGYPGMGYPGGGYPGGGYPGGGYPGGGYPAGRTFGPGAPPV